MVIVIMMMELIIMNVKMVLTGVGAITEVDTEMFIANGGIQKMVPSIQATTVTEVHVLLASIILHIGVVNVMMIMMEVVMNVMITQTTTIWSAILQTIIIIFTMEMIITMNLIPIM